jgi:GLPGLI family protein
MKTILTILTCLLLTVSVQAQTNKIITSGKIAFEKRINMHAAAKNELTDANTGYAESEKRSLETYKKANPQFGVLQSELIFNDNKSLFTPIKPVVPLNNFYGNPIGTQFNTIYTDMATKTITAEKIIYGDQFLLKDSLRKITWRLTDETQDIMGYNCRRANGIMLDSIYIVAYYTDMIWMSGGPESFSGLPGMILKVALPHFNVVWTATKITLDPVPPTKLVAPKKGDVVNSKQLADKLKVASKNWGAWGKYEVKIFQL